MKLDFNAVPASAFTLDACEARFESRNDTDKTVKVELLARAGGEITHWYWGRIIHDMDGISHKSRMPVDYAHHTDEVLGYINRFEPGNEGLRLKGALTPFQEGDRASEVIFKARAGVPYEASITFGGDGEEYQLVREGETTTVNGRDFAGPGVVARRWNLRGVAICPYGADASTETKVFSEEGTRKINLVGVHKMQTDETVAEAATELTVTEQEPDLGAQEVAGDEITPSDGTALGSGEDVTEGKLEATTPIEPVAEDTEDGIGASVECGESTSADEAVEEADGAIDALSTVREEFARIRTDFGDAIAADVFATGGDYNAALRLAYDQLKAKNELLEKRVTESTPAGRPAALGVDVDREPVDAWKAAQRKT